MFRYSIICLFAEGGCSGFSLCFGLGGRFGCPVLGFVCGCVVFFALFVLWRFDAVCFVVGLDALICCLLICGNYLMVLAICCLYLVRLLPRVWQVGWWF